MTKNSTFNTTKRTSRPSDEGRRFSHHEITIYEQDGSGNIKRIVDPEELGIQVIRQAPEREDLQPTFQVAAKFEERTVKPIHPVIYEESFGGKTRRVISPESLQSIPK